MTLDIELEAKSIDKIEPVGLGYNTRLSIELSGVDLANFISVDDIVGEFGRDDLLEGIGEEYIADWLRERDYTVKN